jgi:hypothetical protein
MMIGLRNRLYLSVSSECAWLDVARLRVHLRWFSAEDGRSWSPALYWHRRDWRY